MNYPLISADEESSIKDGIYLMRNKHIRRLPVMKATVKKYKIKIPVFFILDYVFFILKVYKIIFFRVIVPYV
jgi:CBS domain-containing protein